MGAAIVGIGRALPSREVTSAELADRFQLPDGWIEERTGIEARRHAEPADTLVSLGAEACISALHHAAIDSSAVDCVIVATCTADSQLPATAPQIQSAVGCHQAFALDVNAACSGFLYALSVATSFVESQRCRCVLVCGVDIMSRFLDPNDPRSYVLFGDGAGAAVVTPWGTRALGPFELKSDGTRADLLRVDATSRLLRMEGREVYRLAVEAMAGSIASVCASSGRRLENLDLVVPHQANSRIITAVGERLNLHPSQAFVGIDRVGNTSAASIPLALLEAASTGRLGAGNVVALTAFGAGFTWGAGLARWVAPQVELEPQMKEAVSA